MIMPQVSDASIAAKRILVFLNLSEPDKYAQFDVDNSTDEIMVSIKKSSYRWANAED